MTKWRELRKTSRVRLKPPETHTHTCAHTWRRLHVCTHYIEINKYIAGPTHCPLPKHLGCCSCLRSQMTVKGNIKLDSDIQAPLLGQEGTLVCARSRHNVCIITTPWWKCLTWCKRKNILLIFEIWKNYSRMIQAFKRDLPLTFQTQGPDLLQNEPKSWESTRPGRPVLCEQRNVTKGCDAEVLVKSLSLRKQETRAFSSGAGTAWAEFTPPSLVHIPGQNKYFLCCLVWENIMARTVDMTQRLRAYTVLQRAQVQFLTPVSGSSQPSPKPALGVSIAPGFQGYLHHHMNVPPYTHTCN